MSLTDSFISLYVDLGLVSPEGKALPLHMNCSKRDICWNAKSLRMPHDSADYNQIALPWIGSRYEELRLHVVGINMNEDGGLDEIRELVRYAQKSIAAGCKRINFGKPRNEYAGTLLFHRLGCYAATIAKAAGVVPNLANDSILNRPDIIANSYEFLAFTNHIKCSPMGDKSKPEYSMWDQCGGHILHREIGLLRPNWILVLGNSDNASYLQNKVFDDCTVLQNNGSIVQNGRATCGAASFNFVIVPHPAAIGYSFEKTMGDLSNGLLANRL